MNSKRVLFIVPSLGVGGMERELVTIANALFARGYRITVLLLSDNNPLASQLNPGITITYKGPKRHLGNQIPYIRYKYYDDGMWETRATAQKLHEYYVGSERYDVEIAFFRGLPVKIVSGGKNKTSILRKSVGTQSIDYEQEIGVRLAWVHSDFEKASGYQNQFKSMKEVYKAYQSMDHVICVSNQVKEGFVKTIGDTGNLETIYNMLPAQEIRDKAERKPEVTVKKDQFHIVLVGRLLDSAKGQKRLIQCVAKLHQEGFPVSLALVGGGRDEDMLRAEIQEKDAGSYITMTGSKMNPYPYIKEADLLVCASYFEGFNLTVAEALILGTPVLSTDCTGPNEILGYGKYGMIVENSPKGLYDGLKKMLNNPEIVWDLKMRAMKRGVFFDENILMDKIETIIIGEH